MHKSIGQGAVYYACRRICKSSWSPGSLLSASFQPSVDDERDLTKYKMQNSIVPTSLDIGLTLNWCFNLLVVYFTGRRLWSRFHKHPLLLLRLFHSVSEINLFGWRLFFVRGYSRSINVLSTKQRQLGASRDVRQPGKITTVVLYKQTLLIYIAFSNKAGAYIDLIFVYILFKFYGYCVDNTVGQYIKRVSQKFHRQLCFMGYTIMVDTGSKSTTPSLRNKSYVWL